MMLNLVKLLENVGAEVPAVPSPSLAMKLSLSSADLFALTILNRLQQRSISMGAEVPAVPEPSLPVTPAAGASPQGSGALPPIDIVTPRLSAIVPTELFRCASFGTGQTRTERAGNKPTASSFCWSEADASSLPSSV